MIFHSFRASFQRKVENNMKHDKNETVVVMFILDN
jgi:hypothetical protein